MFEGSQFILAMTILDAQSAFEFQAARGDDLDSPEQRAASLAGFCDELADGIRNHEAKRKEVIAKREQLIQQKVIDTKQQVVKQLTQEKVELNKVIDAQIKEIVATIPEGVKKKVKV